ncbi:MAG: energy-coupling factor transporter transmembrane protein EcfT, partial [Candidatus Marinimicrobia bacterium]|nr:energy-coupling factor transporter transmembrane protein EcfT [Candidatus Neomarinimicrobiota bacterium]
WFFIHGIVLLLASLWLVPVPEWQLTLFGLAILANILNRISWKIWLLRIFPLLLILLIFQLLITPFYRPLLQQLWRGEWDAAAWWPLLAGLLRLGTPFLAVTAFAKRLSRPELVKDLAALLTPLHWMGINIQRVQMILPLGLRFFPMVLETSKQIRENLEIFIPHQPEESKLIRRLRYWGMLYKSTFVQTLNGALQVGEALALRGWRTTTTVSGSHGDWVWVGMSLIVGLVLYKIQLMMFALWAVMFLWMGLCFLDIGWMNHARRSVA